MVLQLPPRDSNSDHALPADSGGKPRRPPLRPLVGIPLAKSNEAGGRVAAIVIHALILLLLVAPLTSPELREEIFGAGGAGPAGGGGGGSRGNGGGTPKTERMQFVQIAAPTPTPVPVPVPQVVKPPEVKPPVVPPVVTPPPTPKPAEPVKTETKSNTPPVDAPGKIAGVGGGTGNDGSAGTGPGSGGGTGSGVGTGKGTSNGAGTGGGAGMIYPPTPTVMFIPPIPAPSKLKGKEMIAEFDVDSTGKVIDFQVASTNDGAYDRKLRESLMGVRFRPAVNGLGVPVRAKTQIIYTF
jgi:protein TonB